MTHVKFTALTGKFVYGRTMVTTVVRNLDNEQVSQEIPLAQALQTYSGAHYTIENAEDVLRTIVNQFGFAA